MLLCYNNVLCVFLCRHWQWAVFGRPADLLDGNECHSTMWIQQQSYNWVLRSCRVPTATCSLNLWLSRIVSNPDELWNLLGDAMHVSAGFGIIWQLTLTFFQSPPPLFSLLQSSYHCHVLPTLPHTSTHTHSSAASLPHLTFPFSNSAAIHIVADSLRSTEGVATSAGSGRFHDRVRGYTVASGCLMRLSKHIPL